MAAKTPKFLEELSKNMLNILSDEPQSAEDIAKKLSVSFRLVNMELHKLIASGGVKCLGYKPIMYIKITKKEKFEMAPREEWKGTPTPYMRPGSYTPPEPRVCMISKASVTGQYLPSYLK